MRSISDKECLALKAATRRAVDMAGGSDGFEHMTRVKQPAIAKYGSAAEDNLEKFMPIDVAVEADKEAGSPIILSKMAELQGFKVVPVDDPCADATKPLTVRDALRIANEAADVVKAITDALEGDDRIDASEERLITREIDDAVKVLLDALCRVRVRT